MLPTLLAHAESILLAQTPQPSGGFDRFMGRPPSVPVSRPETAQDQLRQQYHRQVGQPGQSSGSSQAPLSIDAARQRALEAILKVRI